MAELEITVKTKDGKEIAISDVSKETWAEIHKADAEARIPVARLAESSGGGLAKADRLILKITPSIRERVASEDYIVIDLQSGKVVFYETAGRVLRPYYNIKNLTPKD